MKTHKLSSFKTFFSPIIIGAIIILIILCGILSFFGLNIISSGSNDFTGLEKRIFLHRDPFFVGAKAEVSDTRLDLRLPLVKPYVIYHEEISGGQWYIRLENTLKWKENDPLYAYAKINKVSKISVEDGIIYVYTTFIENSKKHQIQWFILIPSEEFEKGFENKNDFLKYLDQNNLAIPEWITPYDAYEKFVQTGCLDWIPDCVK
ncbi:MAG: hypothetical protein AB9891_03820 [Anaerolineaceae bacterium]